MVHGPWTSFVTVELRYVTVHRRRRGRRRGHHAMVVMLLITTTKLLVARMMATAAPLLPGTARRRHGDELTAVKCHELLLPCLGHDYDGRLLYTGAGILNMLHGTACGVHRALQTAWDSSHRSSARCPTGGQYVNRSQSDASVRCVAVCRI